jgi:hypothetical protein
MGRETVVETGPHEVDYIRCDNPNGCTSRHRTNGPWPQEWIWLVEHGTPGPPDHLYFCTWHCVGVWAADNDAKTGLRRPERG